MFQEIPTGFFCNNTRFALNWHELEDHMVPLAEAIAQRTVDVFDDKPLDIISVDLTGTFVAYAGQVGRQALGLQGNTLRYIPPKRALGIRESLEGTFSGAPILLFDNSLRTGKTFRRAMRYLLDKDIQPEAFMKLIDYEDTREEKVQALVQKYGMTCISVFTRQQVQTQNAP